MSRQTKQVELETISKTMSLESDSFTGCEIAKASNGMLFKLYADVHNGSHAWIIQVWSNALCQWNVLATYDMIPEMRRLDYYMCRNAPKDLIIANWSKMREFIKVFVSALDTGKPEA